MSTIYLDNNATTPLDPRVLDAMLPYLREHFGNAASTDHHPGRLAAEAVERARQQVAGLVGATAQDIIWTSGATESCNLAIKGVARHYRERGRHVVTQTTEHPAVLDTCRHLEREGFRVTYLPVDRHGVIDVNQLRDALTDDTVLVSIMAANNETGTLQPIAQIGSLCKERGVLFHTDAAQAVGRIPFDVVDMGVDLAGASGHKIYGPKGVGMLYIRRDSPTVRCDPILHGGGHEGGIRSGTLNVPGIVGFGAAAELCRNEFADDARRLTELRDRLWDGLRSELDDIVLNGHPEQRLCNTVNISFADTESESVIAKLNDLAVSSGSACTTADPGPSHVLRAMGIPDDLIYGSIRFSLGRGNTATEVDSAVRKVAAAVRSSKTGNPPLTIPHTGE